MPTSTERDRDPQRERERDRPASPRDEPRDFETQVSDDDRNYDAPFDADLEPIEDQDIDTDGSER